MTATESPQYELANFSDFAAAGRAAQGLQRDLSPGRVALISVILYSHRELLLENMFLNYISLVWNKRT
jgi:hypothetical protein